MRPAPTAPPRRRRPPRRGLGPGLVEAFIPRRLVPAFVGRAPLPRGAWIVAAVLLAGGWLWPHAAGAVQDEPTAPVAAADDGHAGDPAAAAHTEHTSIVAPLLLAIVIILFGAKLCGDLFERVGVPSVVGELTLGIVLGNFALLFGSDALEFIHPPTSFEGADATNVGAILELLAEIGVILLLFEVGLECTVREMMRVGWTSLFVALAGVIAPILLGFVISKAFFFTEPGDWQEPAFIGATLCATSVGITARVLRDMDSHRTKESQIILGAAVIDDVLGLIVLAVVQGAIAASLARALAKAAGVAAAAAGAEGGGDPFWWDVGETVGLAALFLGGALALGAVNFPRFLFRMACHLRGRGLLVVTALLICFGFSWVANYIGLATIVGAFAAGLILEQAQYKELGERDEIVELEDAIRPLAALFVPIFFVSMGMRVDLNEFVEGGSTLWPMALTFTGLAVLGKMVCSFAVLEKGVNKVAVGVGMIPRGEVGLIFAAVGAGLLRYDPELGEVVQVITPTTFAAIVFMVIVTTVVTPPLLKWSLKHGGSVPVEEDDDGRPDDGDVPEALPDVAKGSADTV